MTPEKFAVALLQRLHKPVTEANVKALVGWQRAEGGHWNNSAKYNPLNTTQSMPGYQTFRSVGQGAANIGIYRNWEQGLEATVKTLRNGRYRGILAALGRGNDPGAVAQAIGSSPWGTSAGTVASAIGATGHVRVPKYSGGGGGSAGTTTTTTTSTQVDQGARRALLAQYLLDRGNPDALLTLAAGMQNLPTNTTTTVDTTRTRGGGSSYGGDSGFAKSHSPLLELFWQGQGGIDAKNGVKEPQGFVSGHTDHVHVAAGPKTVVELGRIAQQKFGLNVGENPSFGGVHPVHVANSYHYKGEAIDVSGSPDRMRAFAHYVAQLYHIK